MFWRETVIQAINLCFAGKRKMGHERIIAIEGTNPITATMKTQ